MSFNNESTFFKKNGYLILNNFLNKEIEPTKQAIERILALPNCNDIIEFEDKEKKIPRRIYTPSSRDEYFYNLIRSDKLLDIIACLIGDNIAFNNDFINMKSSKIGKNIEWHQDFPFMLHTNTDVVTVLFFVDDANSNNGPLEVCVGSHKKGAFSHKMGGTFSGIVDEKQVKNTGTCISLEVQAGTVIIMHSLLLHKSEINKSSKPRRAFTSMFRSTDAYPLYISDNHRFIKPESGLVRGQYSDTVRFDAGIWELPITNSVFNSIYELQDGSHSLNNKKSTYGYFTK